MSERRQAVFMVRMWSEPSSQGGLEWRGSVDNVSTKKRIYFANIGAMCEFMLVERDRPPAPVDPGERPGNDDL